MLKSHKLHNSSIKVKVGLCSLCDGNIEVPLIKGMCQNHYWQSKRKPIQKKEVKTIRKVAPKRAKEIAQYIKVKLEYLNEHPFCESCGKSATDLHHMKGRLGKDIYDKRYFKALCRTCHDLTETQPLEARKLGLSISKLQKHTL